MLVVVVSVGTVGLVGATRQVGRPPWGTQSYFTSPSITDTTSLTTIHGMHCKGREGEHEVKGERRSLLTLFKKKKTLINLRPIIF